MTLNEIFVYETRDVENNFSQLCKIGFTLELVEIFQAMKVYTSILEEYLDGSILQPDLVKFCDQRNLIQHHLMSLPSANELSGKSHQERQIYEVCRISGIIYNTAVIFPLPGLATPLPALSRISKRFLQTCDLNLYLSLPDVVDIFLWAIILGGVASTDTHEKAWFVESLKRLAAAAHLSQWYDIKQSLKRILWLDSACDRAGKQLWSEVEQGLPSSPRYLAKASPLPTPELSEKTQASVRREVPCRRCRKRRVRCDKIMPCQNCRRHGSVCAYDEPISKLRKRVTDLEDQLADIKSFEHTSNC
jgi:hypothetical protein